MKVPPSEKDKTITRRTVKGAAGGMKGVDYEDDRRPDATEAPLAESKVRARRAALEKKILESTPKTIESKEPAKPTAIVGGPTELSLEDEQLAATEAKRSRVRRHIARDRMSVDKDAPETLKKRRWEHEEPDEDQRRRQEREELKRDGDVLEFDTFGEPGTKGESRAHLFKKEHKPEPGDLSLTRPDDIQRAFAAPLAYAKHVMILGEAFRRSTGATRDEAIEYLARMFVALSDRSFGRLALKEFGPSTGIIDVYPLEVIAHVLEKYPGFLPKVGFGRLFRNVPSEEGEVLHTDTRTPLVLDYPEDFKIRGFALLGGGRPGYVFEPDVEMGHYRLLIQTSGRYQAMVSALGRGGYTLIDRFTIKVRARKVEDLSIKEEASYYPHRSEVKVRAWPMPDAPQIDPRELLEVEEEPRAKSSLSRGEIIAKQQRDALRGPLPTRDATSDELTPRPGEHAGLSEEDDEILRLAVEEVIEAVATIEHDTGDLYGDLGDTDESERETHDLDLEAHEHEGPESPDEITLPQQLALTSDEDDAQDRTQPILFDDLHDETDIESADDPCERTARIEAPDLEDEDEQIEVGTDGVAVIAVIDMDDDQDSPDQTPLPPPSPRRKIPTRPGEPAGPLEERADASDPAEEEAES